MDIVRNIKLSKLGIYQIKPEEKGLYEYIEKNLLNLKMVDNKYGYDYDVDYINYKNQSVFSYNHTIDYLYLDLNFNFNHYFDTTIDYKDFMNYLAVKVHKLRNIENIVYIIR